MSDKNDHESNSPTNPFSLPKLAPIRAGRRAILSANVLVSYLSRFDIISCPERSQAKFKWVTSLFGQSSISVLKNADPSILYLCTENLAPQYLDAFPTLFFVVVSRSADIPEWIPRNRNRVILVHSEDKLFFINSTIRDLFSALLAWEDEMEGIVLRREPISKLLTEASRITDSFICMTDAGHSLIAYTKRVDPPDDVHKNLVETGCYDEETIAHLDSIAGKISTSWNVVADESSYYDGFAVLHCPIFFDGSLFGLLTIVDNVNIAPAAFRDLFKTIVHYSTRLFETFWDEKLQVDSPWYKVLTNLIKGKHMPEQFVKIQLSQTNLQEAQLFKLICFDVGIKTERTARTKATQLTKSLNAGKNYTFAYNDTLLTLCYLNSPNDVHFSSRNMEREIDRVLHKPYGISAGISRNFDNLLDIGLAYRQARLALNFASVTDREQEFAGMQPLKACYSFDYMLPYYMLVDSCRNNELSVFSLRRSVLEQIVNEDRENGTHIAELLWMYLCNGHSATAIAKQMHIHRNTVLYHIDKIQKTYNISLDNVLERNRLLHDFRIYFLTDAFSHPIEYEKLLEIPNKDSRDIE